MSDISSRDPLRSLPGYALRRASARAMGDLAQRLTPCGLRPSEASALVMVLENGSIAQRDLGRALDISSGNLATLVTKLVDAGYCRRQPIDGRAVRLSLTGEGKRVARKAFVVMQQHENDLMARVPEHLHAGLLEALDALAFDPPDD